jgi:hypothetical protein
MPRFVSVDENSFRDALTGLDWKKAFTGEMTEVELNALLKNTGFPDDWRLPNGHEIMSLKLEETEEVPYLIIGDLNMIPTKDNTLHPDVTSLMTSPLENIIVFVGNHFNEISGLTCFTATKLSDDADQTTKYSILLCKGDFWTSEEFYNDAFDNIRVEPPVEPPVEE